MTTSAAPQATAAAARRGVIRRFAAPMSRIAKAGTMANVPPTLAPNPGQPDTATTASPTAATVSSALLVLALVLPLVLVVVLVVSLRPSARMPSQPAQNRPGAAKRKISWLPIP